MAPAPEIKKYLASNLRIKENLASGSFGCVSRVVQKSDDELVEKLKRNGTEDPNPLVIKRLIGPADRPTSLKVASAVHLNEIEVYRRLSNTNSNQFINYLAGISAGQTGQPWMVFKEQITSLHTVVYPDYKLSQVQVITIWIQLVEALSHLHDKLQMVHFDVRPPNVLITQSGGVVLADFGLASEMKLRNGYLHARTPGMGCKQYMTRALIQKAKWVTPAVDYWSLYISICELATGYYPFRAQKLRHDFNFPVPYENDKTLRHLIRPIREMLVDLGKDYDTLNSDYFRTYADVACSKGGILASLNLNLKPIKSNKFKPFAKDLPAVLKLVNARKRKNDEVDENERILKRVRQDKVKKRLAQDTPKDNQSKKRKIEIITIDSD